MQPVKISITRSSKSLQNIHFIPPISRVAILCWLAPGTLWLGIGSNFLFAQQAEAHLQWLPHPAAVSQPIQPTAAESPSAPPSGGTTTPYVPHKEGYNDTSPVQPLQKPMPSTGIAPPGGHKKHPLEDPFQEMTPPAPLPGAGAEKGPLPSHPPLPKVLEPPYLPEEETRPMPGPTPAPAPTPGHPMQVRAECLPNDNLLLPIRKLTTRTDIDPNIHPEISPEEEARLRQAGQPTRLEQLRRAKAEFDAKMWCEPPPTALPERMSQPWPETTVSWKASALCHKPLYFEQPHLERYGHSTGPLSQPIVSAGHFYLTIPTLPYQLALWPPYECIYALGHYRPGSCAPYYLDPIPLSIRAGLAQAGAWVGGVFLVP